jgi:hypothetical protein
MADGARASELARLLGVGLTTLQRWRRQFAGAGDGVDCRKGSHRHVAHRLSEEERQRILLTCSEPEFAALPSGQIVPVLADVIDVWSRLPRPQAERAGGTRSWPGMSLSARIQPLQRIW